MTRLRHLWLTDFRGYRHLDVEFSDGLTAVLGANGQGKTNLVEAVAWLGSMRSFRGAAGDVLPRVGAEAAIIRAEADQDGRTLLIEAEVPRSGRTKVQVNRQRISGRRDLLGLVPVSVFSPDDLALVKEGPSGRRGFLDDTMVGRHPRYESARAEVERVLRQRNALLKQAKGRLDDEITTTLDVWDSKLVAAGTRLVEQRVETLELLQPRLCAAYDELAGAPAEVTAAYHAPWREQGLAAALADARRDDLRRGVSTVGPHRDEIALAIGGLPARTHASQGEQRSMALALRLAAHRLVIDESGQTPLLVLDDVFSELDPGRADALLAQLPDGQALVTSAAGLPPRAAPDTVWTIADHVLTREAAPRG